jgi:hypothetical protein
MLGFRKCLDHYWLRVTVMNSIAVVITQMLILNNLVLILQLLPSALGKLEHLGTLYVNLMTCCRIIRTEGEDEEDFAKYINIPLSHGDFFFMEEGK